MLELVGLDGKADRMPHELSGGEQQRVAIARAFVNRPLVLLADEPTGNLDPDTSQDIMLLLERINRTGTTVLMATHDHSIVDSMRRRVVELDLGRVVRDESRGVYGVGAVAMRTDFVVREVVTGLRRNVTMTIAMVLTTAISLGPGRHRAARRAHHRPHRAALQRPGRGAGRAHPGRLGRRHRLQPADLRRAAADPGELSAGGVGALREPAAGLRALPGAVRRAVARRRGPPAVAAGHAAGEAGRPGRRRRRPCARR